MKGVASVYWHIVVNTHAGTGEASQLVKTLIRLIAKHDVDYAVHETRSPNDGFRIAKSMLHNTALHLSGTVVAVVGGDGSLNELVNGIMQLEPHATTRGIRLALVPAGTANAVYHSLFPETCKDPTNFDRFLSVKAALRHPGTLAPLSICRVMTAPDAKPVYSCVVTSTCLHANILETASTEEMRKAYPGVERFKKAAEQHIGTSYSAKLTLFPVMSQNSRIHKYSIEHDEWRGLSPDSVVIEGEFAYFVSALVDRFETAFRIAPYSSPTEGRPAEATDIVLVRYKPEASQQENAHRLVSVLMAAYEDGAHVRLTEDIDGKQEPIVEYYRVGGFEWQPVCSPWHYLDAFRKYNSLQSRCVQLNEAAKLICIDGDTSRLTEQHTLKSETVLQGGSGVDADPFSVFC